jgi:NADH:ubiquinone oxidoreductase subunit 6 (subunit J)
MVMATLDFYFLSLTYLIVYVGAIMILLLFVIMMVEYLTATPLGKGNREYYFG